MKLNRLVRLELDIKLHIQLDKNRHLTRHASYIQLEMLPMMLVMSKGLIPNLVEPTLELDVKLHIEHASYIQLHFLNIPRRVSSMSNSNLYFEAQS